MKHLSTLLNISFCFTASPVPLFISATPSFRMPEAVSTTHKPPHHHLWSVKVLLTLSAGYTNRGNSFHAILLIHPATTSLLPSTHHSESRVTTGNLSPTLQ